MVSYVVAACAAVCLVLQGAAAQSVHTVFSTECKDYFTWQTIVMAYNFKRIGHPGKLTRLMSCSEEDLKKYRPTTYASEFMSTHISRNYAHNLLTSDGYLPFNKPASIMEWMREVKPPEDYILVLDPDMLLRDHFDAKALAVRPGMAAAAHYSYLVGAHNDLAATHIPEVRPRTDSEAGPNGRRGDVVGPPILMRMEDMQRVAPLWLQYSADVRENPVAWNATMTGDAASGSPGVKPWISEMYGYIFAAAKQDVWHKCLWTAMLYPSATPFDPPMVMHYGLLHTVPNSGFEWNKAFYQRFDALQCPPWNITATSSPGGLMPMPASPLLVNETGRELMRDLLSLEVNIRINEAFCDRHLKECPPSEELHRECARVRELAADLKEAWRRADEKAGTQTHVAQYQRPALQLQIQTNLLDRWQFQVETALQHLHLRLAPLLIPMLWYWALSSTLLNVVLLACLLLRSRKSGAKAAPQKLSHTNGYADSLNGKAVLKSPGKLA